MIEYKPIKIFFNLGKINIYSWGVLVAFAFLITYILCSYKAKKEKLDEKIITNLFLIGIIFGFIGSRILYAIENGFDNFYAIWEGGLSWYGGFLLAYLAIFIYIKKKNLSSRYLEIIALFLPLGHAIGRIGCFLNWDDYGKVTNLAWGIKVGNDDPRHPTQIYEIIANIIIFLFLFFLDKKKKNKFIIKSYLFFYPLARFFIDFFRESKTYFSLTLAQWISLIIIFILVFLEIIKFIKNKKNKTK